MSGGSTCIGKGGINMSGGSTCLEGLHALGGGLHAWQRGATCLAEGGATCLAEGGYMLGRGGATTCLAEGGYMLGRGGRLHA